MQVRSIQLEKRCRSPKEFPRLSVPEVAFCGRSNVGKSSLINALVNRKGLVKVSSTPGKTRTIDFFRLNDRFRFVDLPGYGYAAVSRDLQERWKSLIESYFRGRERLAAVVWILDIRREISERDWMLWEWLRGQNARCIAVCTKADKLPHGQRMRRLAAIREVLREDVSPILFSSRTGLGKDALWREIRRTLSEIDEDLRDDDKT
ncbi:MAG: ribosome biogenesis GTP-binding protein YihA/YsxC [bacterium]